jgi:hypothetical protein
MKLSDHGFPKHSGLRWAGGVCLAVALTLPALPAAAQPELTSGPIAATPANCAIHFSVANPNPGNQEIPRTLVMSGTALDATATSGTGISQVQAFLGNRDTGGAFIGAWSPTTTVVGPPGAWSLTADMPPNAIGGQQVFVYGMSSVTGQEAVISIPIAFGSVPTDELSNVATSFCPDMLTPPVPINPLLAQSRG